MEEIKNIFKGIKKDVAERCKYCEKSKTTETLTDKVNGCDRHMEKESGIPAEIFAFHRIYNPLVFYCRLTDLGFNKECAIDLTVAYEEMIYEFVGEELKQKYGTK